MRWTRTWMAALAVAAAGAVLAQGPSGDTGGGGSDGGVSSLALCIDTADQDKQPDFSRDAGIPSAIIVTDDDPPKLRLNTNLNALDPEKIILPFEQDLTALIVDDRAGSGASSTLGWFYYDELIDAGYVDDNGTQDTSDDDRLLDTNHNGVPDFHEDLYNLNPSHYIGSEGPRCNRTFTHQRWGDAGTVTLREPDLLLGPCNAGGNYTANTGPRRWQGGAGYPAQPTTGGVVGRRVRDFEATLLVYDPYHGRDNLRPGAVSSGVIDTYFSDRGLFPHIPNLLEPRHALNGNRGIGNLIFLSTDDDETWCHESESAECFAPRQGWTLDNNGQFTRTGTAWDKSDDGDGIPDYKASAFDSAGRLITGRNPAAAITKAEDQVVPLGRLAGNREIVFFLVTYVEQIYGPATDSCFITRPTTDGRQVQCDLWMHGDINVFFTKTPLNLDLHQSTDPLVVDRKNLRSEWLDGRAYGRLENDPAYGGVVFPNDQTQNVHSVNRRAAHTLVGAPRDNPLVWILGWEDQNAGGDRTYSDIVILINKQNNGSFRSDVVSDISPDISLDFTITEVTFTVEDQPYYAADGGSLAPCSRAVPLPDGGMGQRHPDITYEVALDCKVCQEPCDTAHPTYVQNDSPNWLRVPIPDSDGGVRNETAVLQEFLEQGRVGTQLCWRAVMESPGEACQPTIHNINVSYKAQRSGEYGRASLIPMANAVVHGVYETPGRTWVADGGVDQVSIRTYDNRPDTIDRGHLYLKKLYEPATLAPHDPAEEVWDSGKWLRDLMRDLEPQPQDPLNARKLVTLNPATRQAVAVKDLMARNATSSPVFPDSLCTRRNGSVYLYDLDGRNGCTADDRLALRDWLYGWEDRHASTLRNRMRTWPLGGVNLSTAAVIGTPNVPAWLLEGRNLDAERQKFVENFRAPNADRRTVTYVGTTQGYLHALGTGHFRTGDDPCTPGRIEYQGYFGRSGGCGSDNDYGLGSELFAYLPYKMLPYYVENYRRANDDYATERATLDASPSVADVDLRGTDYRADTGHDPRDTDEAWRPRSAWNEGAKTVLASATGPRQSIFFALDITNPADPNYPAPLWEFDMKRDRFTPAGAPCTTTGNGCAPLASYFTGATPKPDTRGSRHAPSLVRMDFGADGGKKWVSLFGTDYATDAGAVGTVYLMDLKTGLPARVRGSGARALLAGVVTLGTTADVGAGIGGEPIPLDVNGDGSVDVIYVPSTSGKIYRINPTWSNTGSSTQLGKVLASCVVADAQAVPGIRNPSSQRIYSSISASVATDGSRRVRLYFGTANNPDIANEPEDTADPRPRYHLMAFEDRHPVPSQRPGAQCPAHFEWARELGEGQVVWGGVSTTQDGVFTTSAVGRAASACDLDSTTSGRVYAYSTAGAPLAGNDTPIDGHGTHAPVLYDNHLLIVKNGQVRALGSGPYNNPTSESPRSSSRVLIWDVRSGSRVQEVVP
ncbi:pilus assembly protein PilY [Corallococcus macrosporus]|uniref:Pilus assembly protein PilY n=1 Tax=Corallococcus macrosporus DSM 14697 TaxID=1189310 RepID=A0A250JNL6_9BACT|nr:pilus assembly protein PilY [Corallococcus macrosporus]ATB45459.1 pilus assembly protein PilY [Corallococcus macrosporus DSM 14697]